MINTGNLSAEPDQAHAQPRQICGESHATKVAEVRVLPYVGAVAGTVTQDPRDFC